MRPHHDGSNVLKLRLVLALVLGQWHQSPLVQVLGDGFWVGEQAKDLGGDILGEPMLCISWLEDGAIEAIWPQPFIEVGGPHGLLHILGGEHPLGDLYSRLQT